MKRIRLTRPSPALAIACIALFVAMGGVSYGVATGSIDSREIKNGSIRNPDFKNGTLRGNEAKRDGFGGGAIKESTLGKVPSATAADNATNLGGKGADKYTTRWALINESGQIERQTGGFSVVNCYQANGNCYINAGEDVTNNGLHAQISIANTDAGTASDTLSGETGVAACFASTVNCGPAGTDSTNGGNNGVLVVAPRDSTGNAPGDPTPGNGTDEAPAPADASRFYVFVTGSESQ